MKKNAVATRLKKMRADVAYARRKLDTVTALNKSLKEKSREAKQKAKDAREEWRQLRKARKLAARDERTALKELKTAEKKVHKLAGKTPVPKRSNSAKAPPKQRRRAPIVVTPTVNEQSPNAPAANG